MAQKHFVIDGDTALDQQENSLNTAQNLLRAEIASYAKGQPATSGAGTPTTPKHPNFVAMNEVGLGVPVREIFLVIPDDLAAEKIRQAGKDRVLVFSDNVFVEGVVKKVAGFRHQ